MIICKENNIYCPVKRIINKKLYWYDIILLVIKMDETVKNSIKSRYDAFEISYELTDSIKKEVDALFDKIYDFGKTCKDAMDFESKFASSPLNQEYINMFTKVSQKCKAKAIAHAENNVEEKSKGQKVLEDIGSDAKYLADDLTMPARRKARMEFDSKMRNTPLGKIEQANNIFWLFKKIKGKVKPNKKGVEDTNNNSED